MKKKRGGLSLRLGWTHPEGGALSGFYLLEGGGGGGEGSPPNTPASPCTRRVNGWCASAIASFPDQLAAAGECMESGIEEASSPGLPPTCPKKGNLFHTKGGRPEVLNSLIRL